MSDIHKDIQEEQWKEKPHNEYTFVEYQKAQRSLAIYRGDLSVVYPALGLGGESGEVLEKIKKVLRDNNGVFTEEKKQEIKKELGDVLWYLSDIAYFLGISLDDVAKSNIDKLTSRNKRNVQYGSGDNR